MVGIHNAGLVVWRLLATDAALHSAAAEDPLSSSESPKLSIHSQKNANFAAPNEEFRLSNEQSLHQSNGR